MKEKYSTLKSEIVTQINSMAQSGSINRSNAVSVANNLLLTDKCKILNVAVIGSHLEIHTPNTFYSFRLKN